MAKNPESLDKLNNIKNTQELKSFVNTLSRDIEDEKSKRQGIDNAIDRLNRLRFGVRAKKVHPWPGSANYSIPLIDTDIARIKPSYINLVYQADPMATFEPFGAEDIDPARKREQLFDWRMRHRVNFFKPLNYGVDQVLGSEGQTVFRIIWKYSSRNFSETLDLSDFDEQTLAALYDPRVTDDMIEKIIQEEFRVDLSFDENVEEIKKAVQSFRDGETEFDMTFLESDNDQAEVIPCSIKDDLVVPMDTKEINDARFIDYKFWRTKNDLKIAIADDKYDSFDDKDIDSWSNSSSSYKNNNYVSEDLILIHETCCWYDINDDGIKERCITTWPDASPESILRFIELPYEHGEWPYKQIKRELTEDGFYSTRGIPSLDEDFQVGISTAINQAIDNGTLLNAPERVYKKGALSNPKNKRFVPGEAVEVNGDISQYQIRQSVNGSQPGLFQQAQFLKSFSDNRHGNVTSGFGGQSDLPGMGERGNKTAKEVEAITSQQSQSLSLDLQVFNQQLAGVYYQIDALYNQFGPEEEEVLITNQEPVKISRREIQGKFNITPNGRVDSSSPQQRLQRMMFAFNMGFDNPFVRQKDLVQQLYKTFDSRLAQLLLKSNEELQQEQQQALMAQQQAVTQQAQMGIEMRKLTDDLDIRKEALLTPITGKKHASD